jgi:hypothetical protein
MTEGMTNAEITRAIRAVLKALPGVKFAVSTGYDVQISWDDGPEQSQIENALVAAGLAKHEQHYQCLRIGRRSLCLLRYNAAERAARELRWEESRQREQRVDELVREAQQFRGRALAAPPELQRPLNRDDIGQAAQDAFEALRQRVEADVARGGFKHERRPTWAPPLLLEGELLELCLALGYLKPEDKSIARLWATFADPKQVGSYFRERFSKHALSGITCRGFQLYAGAERQNSLSILFEAQKDAKGWRFGPGGRLCGYSESRHPNDRKWETLTRSRIGLQELDPKEAERLAKEIAALEAEDLKLAEAFHAKQRQRARIRELARLRVLDFAGAPDAQMQLAGRLCGHCFVCFKELTDPISLERGIGPDCYQAEINSVHGATAYLREQNSDITPENIAELTRQPLAFVTAVLQQRGDNNA